MCLVYVFPRAQNNGRKNDFLISLSLSRPLLCFAHFIPHARAPSTSSKFHFHFRSLLACQMSHSALTPAHLAALRPPSPLPSKGAQICDKVI